MDDAFYPNVVLVVSCIQFSGGLSSLVWSICLAACIIDDNFFPVLLLVNTCFHEINGFHGMFLHLISLAINQSETQ